MNVVALYKTWDGADWLPVSLASIYDHVESIVLVHSERSWLGEPGNTARATAVAWASEHDTQGKVHHVDCDTTSQEQQYAIGLDFIARNAMPCDIVMVVDADEIWTEVDLEKAREQIADDQTGAMAYRCSMHTYLKTPFYQVDPPYGRVLCFFRPGGGAEYLTAKPRGVGCPAKDLNDVWMYHFTYVRQSEDEVLRKIRQSSTVDGDTQTPEWKRNVWDRLPLGENLHGCYEWRHVWKRIRRVFRHQIPIAAWRSSFLNTFLHRTDTLMEPEMDVLYALSQGLHRVVELGTHNGVGATILSLGADRVDTFDLFEDVPRSAVVHVTESNEVAYADNASWVVREADARHNLAWYSNVAVHKQDVIQAASNFEDGSICLVFVDADHSYECTIGCSRAWIPKIRSGGVLLFHDYNAGNPGVIRAVDEIRSCETIQQFTLPTEWPGSLVGFHKS